jgi:hypothetical protein
MKALLKKYSLIDFSMVTLTTSILNEIAAR